MCGRVHVKRTIAEMVGKFSFAAPGEVSNLANQYPRWNGAPRQDYPIIVVDELERGTTMFVSARWGLIPYWVKDANGGAQPINAKSETVKTNGMFKAAYQKRRALMPIDGFFEWKDILGTGKNKQPYAIAMKSGEPFALAAVWENWTDPATGENVRTFTVLTCEPNPMVAEIHNRMPVIIAPTDYMTWLTDPDPEQLMRPFPEELMAMWKIGKVTDRPDVFEPAVEAPAEPKPAVDPKPAPPPMGDLFD